jgi:hypothetical protein
LSLNVGGLQTPPNGQTTTVNITPGESITGTATGTVYCGTTGTLFVEDGGGGFSYSPSPGASKTIPAFGSASITISSQPIYADTYVKVDGTLTININIVTSPANGTVTVTADRTANWQIGGQTAGASFSGSGTSGGPYSAPAGTYLLIDPTTQSYPYGFIDNPTFSLNGSPNIFASLVKTAEASSCGGWVCNLSAGGTVNYVLTTTTCNISVETNVDGNIASMSSLPMTFSGPLNSYSYTSTPQTPYSIADSSGSTFTLTLPSIGSWSGYVTDYIGTDVTASDGTITSYPATTLSPNPACVAGGSLTFVAKYLTRAILLVQ